MVRAHTSHPAALATLFGHQGLYRDVETNFFYNRGRMYAPAIGRYVQRDPNQTAQLLGTALVFNARSYLASLGIDAGAQYGDGMSLYEHLRSNPLIYNDPVQKGDAALFASQAIRGVDDAR